MMLRRYPGPKPFEKSQQDIFFGRQAAIEVLHRRVSLERLTVLYGKSGDGKSSLVNAGLVPHFEAIGIRKDIEESDKFLTVKIRFEAYQLGQAEQLSPIQKAVGQIRTAFQPQTGQSISLTQKLLPDDNSLWAIVKDIHTDERRLLLIFDQFEELFTYPVAQYDAFGQQLAELFNVLVPMRYVRAFEQNHDALTREENNRLHRQPKTHVLLVIRSDRLILLNQLQTHLPNIQKINYELPPLSKTEAREAVLLPATEEGHFASPAFTYTPGALRKIIQSLTDNDQQPIASFQLQILCESIEDKVLTQKLTEITETNVEDPALLYENYYRERIARLKNPKDQAAARHLIEDGLILEEENRRLSLYEGQIRKIYAVPEHVLHQLEDDHLLRRESNLQGGFSYELSHDTLVKPIAKFKKIRLEEERKREKTKERWKLASAVFAATLAIMAAFWSNKQYKKAENLTNAVEKLSRAYQNSALFLKLREYDPTLALNIAKYNYEQHNTDTVVGEIVREGWRQSNIDYSNLKIAYYCSVIKGHDATFATFSLDSKFVLSGSGDSTIAKIWDLYGREMKPYNLPKYFIGALFPVYGKNEKGDYVLSHYAPIRAFSPDEKQFLTCDSEGNVTLWDGGIKKRTFLDASYATWSLAFSPDGKNILIGCKNGTAKLWDLQGRLIKTFDKGPSDILSVVFSPDGKKILTGSKDGKAKLWNITGDLIATFVGHSQSVMSVAFSSNGQHVLTGSKDKTAKLWDLQGNNIQTYSGHASDVKLVSMSPNNLYTLTASGDTLKLWRQVKDCYGCDAYYYNCPDLWKTGVKLELKDLKKAWDAGAQLEPEDLRILWESEVSLKPEELKKIGRNRNKSDDR